MATRFLLTAAVLLVASSMLPPPVPAAEGSGSGLAPTRSPQYEQAVRAVRAGDYRTAIDLLEQVVASEPDNADAYNELAFSHRKLGEVAPALRYYERALSLDPEHRGAHEYLGELYLQLDDLAKARAHLARLDDLCWLGCEEYDELKAAIAKYEAAHRG